MKSLAITSTALASIMAIGLVSAGSTSAQAQPADMTVALKTVDITHAIGRLAFGASPDDHRSWFGKSREELVSTMLSQLDQPASTQPSFLGQRSLPSEFIFLKNEALGELAIGTEYLKMSEMATWQIAEMAVGDTPFREAMTWFWMDHFVTSFENTESAAEQYQHLSRIQAQMFGNFRDMLADQLQNPSMLTYLNNNENTADAPNENLAREVLELFTLGRDRGYGEGDIREIARALTGHGVSDNWSEYRFHPDQHDKGHKTIFGTSGNYDASDLPTLILDNPAFGPYIAEKVWLYFVSPTPDATEVERWAAEWRAADWDMKTLYATMLSSEAFWAEANRGTLVKSPIELMAGTARTFGMRINDPEVVFESAADIGQALFLPPNVEGWSEGIDWITDASLIARTSVMTDFLDTYAEPSYLTDEHIAGPAQGSDFQEIQSGVRIGASAVEWAEAWSEPGENAHGNVISIVVADLGVKGKTYDYAAVQIGSESFDGEKEAYLSLELDACGQGCAFYEAAQKLADKYGQISDEDERYDQSWVFLSQWGDAQNFDLFNADELQVIDAIVSNFPALVEATEMDASWKYLAEDAAEVQAEAITATQGVQIASDALRNLKSGQQDVLTLTEPMTVGFSFLQPWGVTDKIANQMLVGGLSAAEVEEMEANGMLNFEEDDIYGAAETLSLRHLKRISVAAPYAELPQWAEALPPALQTAEGMSQVVLAVPPANQPSKTMVQDVTGFLTALLTDPRYNLK